MSVNEGDRLLSMKDFAKLTGLAQTTLRYWDEIGVFSPAYRDEANNYRYYTPMQVISLNFVTTLSALGIPLKDISQIEQDRTPRNIMQLIVEQEIQLDMEMRRLREAYSVIHIYLEMITKGMRANVNEITIETLRELPIIIGPNNEYNGDETFYGAFTKFCALSRPLRINLHFPIGGYYNSHSEFNNEPGRPANFFTVDPTGFERRPEGEYLVAYARGYYGEMGDAPERMAKYMERHNLKSKGPVYVLYLHNEVVNRDEQYLAQIIVAVKKKSSDTQ